MQHNEKLQYRAKLTSGRWQDWVSDRAIFDVTDGILNILEIQVEVININKLTKTNEADQLVDAYVNNEGDMYAIKEKN